MALVIGTTVGELLTRGDGPLQQLREEESYVIHHINPVMLLKAGLHTRLLHGGLGERIVPPYTRGSVSLSLTLVHSLTQPEPFL